MGLGTKSQGKMGIVMGRAGHSMTAHVGARETKVNTNDCCIAILFVVVVWAPRGLLPIISFAISCPHKAIMPLPWSLPTLCMYSTAAYLYVLHLSSFRLPRLARGSGLHPCQ